MSEKPEVKIKKTPEITEKPVKSSKFAAFKQPRALFLLGLVLGALIILGVRFATYMPMHHTHYHANFAVYINGAREEFKDPQYYEDVAICSTSTDITTPQQRAHMHDKVNSVVHVHDAATTWGQFFENIGWYVGPDFVQTKDGTLYKADGTSKLHIVINGQDYTDLTPITNQVIGDKDRLLVSFGDLTQNQIEAEDKTVADTAAKYDESKDPASCSGGHDEAPTFKQRFDNLL